MLHATPPVPLPDPPPQAKIAYLHWSSFYRHPFTLYVWHSNYRSVYRSTALSKLYRTTYKARRIERATTDPARYARNRAISKGLGVLGVLADDEQDLAMTTVQDLLIMYGACWVCSSPREAGIYVNDDLSDVSCLLVCTKDASHGRFSELPKDDMHRATPVELGRLRDRMPSC